MRLSRGKSQGFIITGDDYELEPLSECPGTRYSYKQGVIRMTESVHSWKLLKKIRWEEISDEAAQAMDNIKSAYLKHRARIRKAHRRFKKEGKTDIPVPLKTVPYEHQVRAFGFASSLDACALLMDQGTGKTLVAIAVAGALNPERVLVVCPKAVKPVWPRELAKHADFDFTVAIDKPPEPHDSMQVWVTNYDRLRRELRRILKWKPTMVILDEAHRIKNRKADRTKAAITIGNKVKNKLILSGTILGKCISETWAPFKFLHSDIFGSNYSQFKDRYLVMGGFKQYQVVGYKNEGEYADKLHSIAFRVTKEECLDLPPINYQHLYVEPNAEVKRIYKQFDSELFVETEEGDVVAISEATKQMKLRQFTGGQVKTDTGSITTLSKQKIGVLKETLEDRADKKTIVFFSFTHEIEMAKEVCRQLKLKYITLQGSTPDDERNTFEERFQEDANIKVALIQIATGAEGLTLTAADLAIFYSPSFSYIGFAQARDRIHRIGQASPVTILFIIFKETVDERVVDVLESNGQLIDEYLEKRRDYNLEENIMPKTEFKYTAKTVAEDLGITPADLRKHLRALKIEKPAEGWNWNTKKDADAVAKQVKARIDDLAAKGSEDKAEKKAPAKKTTAAKKTPAKTTAAKKAPTKKTTRSRKAATTEE